MSDEFFTTEDFINANRSPLLQPTQPNYRSTETPPPLDDLDETYDSDATETIGEGAHVWRSKSSKGPDYPDVASKAGREFFTLSPEVACEDRRPSTAAVTDRMLDESIRRRVSGTTDETKVLARAAFEASEKLHAAIHRDGRGAYTTHVLQSGSEKHRTTIQVHEIEPEPMEVSNSFMRKSVGITYPMARSLSSGLSSPKSLNVRPPPKVSLPAIRTKSPSTRSDWGAESKDSIATSPALAKFTITPADGNPQQLPRLQTSPSRSSSGLSPQTKQTLPSLETALSQISDDDGATYPGQSSARSRPSLAQFSQFGPSPSSYSNPSPASAISPPRLPTNPSYWRTTSQETSNSTPSDHTSTAPSAGISTPASSYFGHSPSNSANTPTATIPDTDNMSAISASSSRFTKGGTHYTYGDSKSAISTPSLQLTDESTHYNRIYDDNKSAISAPSLQLTDESNSYNGNYENGSFKCTWPDCNAPPFQTQYLLNSHANVHSNTRPHFCPVQGCPRGPGGQGFKRKNEMIRHGLVHQSPGYVCPFCPDQQHRYPRPDNLQRHVRVHHVDRDRDDPLLRDVLAQRPEGGNRGRRRRLGS